MSLGHQAAAARIKWGSWTGGAERRAGAARLLVCSWSTEEQWQSVTENRKVNKLQMQERKMTDDSTDLRFAFTLTLVS